MKFMLIHEDYPTEYFHTLEEYIECKEVLESEGKWKRWNIVLVGGQFYYNDLETTLKEHITEANLPLLFDKFILLSERYQVSLSFLLQYTNLNLNEAIDKIKEVCIYNGTVFDAARDFIEVTYEYPICLENYINYKLIAKDMIDSGRLIKMNDDWVILNPSDFIEIKPYYCHRWYWN